MQNGVPLSLDDKYTVAESQLLTVALVLKSKAAEYLTKGQLSCMLGAKNQDDVLQCLPQKTRPLVVNVATQISGYADTDNVEVWSPGVSGSVTSPTQGWNAGGNLVVEARRIINMNNEKQTIFLRGVVRRGDIGPNNMVASDSVGDLELEIKGKGVISDGVRQPNRVIRTILRLLDF